MTAALRADGYLTIPASYGGSLGGLVWSSSCDALERWNGTTLAFAEEIRDLLEGVFSRPPVPPFAFVLTLLRVMKDGPDEASVPLDRLWRAHTEARGAAGVPRNAGLLIAELCRGLPATHDAPNWNDVALALARRGRVGNHWSLENVPPLTRDEFVKRIESRLQDYDEVRLLHWLTHGCDPSGAGEKLAEEVDSLPVRVAKLLAAARRRPRLVGAAALVPSLDAALTIPPRRPTADAIPQGGYCDVTTRGEPERLLPGQFALEPDEFIRRYAERELLYFKREEPHDVEKPERIIVLDQGVRTWGSVRLALAGAAYVLLKKDAKRFAGVRLATTGAVDPIDVTEEKIEAIADILESSDLTAHPEAVLDRILQDETATAAGRDIVLLTHPRNLREPDVLETARAAQPGDRLFALAVDDRGRAELSEWTPRGLVAVRSFRVDLEAAEAAKVEGEPAAARKPIAHSNALWTGDIEPVPFPFRPGIVVEPVQFGFEANGEWLVMAGRDGLLQALAFDGSAPEVLPRPFRNGTVLKQVDAILGVNGGVVVCGRIRVPAAPHSSTQATTIVSPGAPVLTVSASGPPRTEEIYVAAHYDLATRRVTLHELRAEPSWSPRWLSFPNLHCVAVCRTSQQPGGTQMYGTALDLETGGRHPGGTDSGLTSRARAAWDRCRWDSSPPYALPIRTEWPALPPYDGPTLYLKGNTIRIMSAEDSWPSFEPQRDGKPLLAGSIIEGAQLAGTTLALALKGPHRRQLVLIEGPDGRVLGELPRRRLQLQSALSPDGKLLVSLRGSRDLAVHATHNITSPLATATWAGLHDRFDIGFSTGPLKLVIRIGGFEHVFRVELEELIHSLSRGARTQQTSERKGFVHHPPTEYDLPRFPSREIAHQWGWRVVRDSLGQVLLYRQEGQLVAAFLVRREKAAVWIPEGNFWGDPALIGGPPSPNAARKIGAAIAAAGGES